MVNIEITIRFIVNSIELSLLMKRSVGQTVPYVFIYDTLESNFTIICYNLIRLMCLVKSD